MSSDPLLDSLLADAAGMLLSTPDSTSPASVPSSGVASLVGGSALGSTLGTVSDKLFSIVCVDCGGTLAFVLEMWESRVFFLFARIVV